VRPAAVVTAAASRTTTEPAAFSAAVFTWNSKKASAGAAVADNLTGRPSFMTALPGHTERPTGLSL
jgi:hypothetical protein